MAWIAYYKTEDGRVLYEAKALEKADAIRKLNNMIPEGVEPGTVGVKGDQIMISGGSGTDNI